MFDISEQLFPNIITLLVQLGATGVIFILYKKYLHQVVLDIMDKKADAFQKEYVELEAIKLEQVEERTKLEAEKEEQISSYNEQKARLLVELETQRERLLKEAQDDAQALRDQASLSIEKERIAMLNSVERQIIDISSLMVEKVLDGYTFNEAQMINALEKEIKDTHARS